MLKEALTTALSWLAFLHAAMVVNFPIALILCSKCGMSENEGWYSLVVNGHLNALDTLPGGSVLWFFGLSPAIWLLLYAWTGSPRIKPWKKPS